MQQLVKIILVLALFPAGNVWAMKLDLTCLSSSAADCGVGLNQLSVTTSDTSTSNADSVSLLFENIDPIGLGPNPYIAEIYIDTPLFATMPLSTPGLPENSFNLLSVSLVPSVGVAFRTGIADPQAPSKITPPNLPDAPSGFDADFGAENVQNSADGIQEDEWLIMKIMGLTESMFLGSLNGIGLHVHAFEDGRSASFVTHVPPVPVPAAFWLFGTALIGFIGFSRRRSV